MSSRPRPASLPAEGGPSSWSFVIRASAVELVRAPAGLQVGGPLADSTHCVTLFLSPCGGLSSAGAVLSARGGLSTPRPFRRGVRRARRQGPSGFPAGISGETAAVGILGYATTSGSTTSSTSSIVVA